MLITSCEARSGLHQLQANRKDCGTGTKGRKAAELRMLQTKPSHLIAPQGPAARDTRACTQAKTTKAQGHLCSTSCLLELLQESGLNWAVLGRQRQTSIPICPLACMSFILPSPKLFPHLGGQSEKKMTWKSEEVFLPLR